MTTDIKYFYYSTPLSIYKYMQIPLNIITDEIIQQYNLKDISVNGIVYIEIQKGILGLKQAAKLADNCLCIQWSKFDYHPSHKHPPYRSTNQEISLQH